MSFFSGGFGGLVGAVGSIAGGLLDRQNQKSINAFNAQQAQLDRDFQKEVMQNQYQWKTADAKKAGLHPLSVVGGGAYSASPSSVPASSSSSWSDALGSAGKYIGDAASAYMNKDQMALDALRAQENHDQNIRESASRIAMNNAIALEHTRRAYNIPMANGMEIITGQTDARNPTMERINKYAWPVNPDGSHSDPVPSSELSEAYENAPGIFAYTPFIDAMYDKWAAILSGKPIDGHYHDWRDNKWRTSKPPRNPLIFWR